MPSDRAREYAEEHETADADSIRDMYGDRGRGTIWPRSAMVLRAIQAARIEAFEAGAAAERDADREDEREECMAIAARFAARYQATSEDGNRVAHEIWDAIRARGSDERNVVTAGAIQRLIDGCEPATLEQISELARLHEEAAPAPWYTVDDPWRHIDHPTYAVSGDRDPHLGIPVLDAIDPVSIETDERIPEDADLVSWCDWQLALAVAARNLVGPLLAALAQRDKGIAELLCRNATLRAALQDVVDVARLVGPVEAGSAAWHHAVRVLSERDAKPVNVIAEVVAGPPPPVRVYTSVDQVASALLEQREGTLRSAMADELIKNDPADVPKTDATPEEVERLKQQVAAATGPAVVRAEAPDPGVSD